MVNRDRLLEKFMDMVRIPSPSLDERDMANYLKAVLTDMGLEVYEDDAGNKYKGSSGNIIGILRAPGKKRVLFSAHMDTVMPCKGVNPIVENGIVKSDGRTVLGGDDKIGIAAILEMLSIIIENCIEHPEIVVVFSIAEEIGLLGAKALDLDRLGEIDYGVVLDADGKPGTVVVKAPYAAKGKLEIVGRAAHAGIEPENGINALYVAAHAISQLKIGRVDEDTTCNIGIVKGGSVVNMVMPSVFMAYEARSFKEEKLESLLADTIRIFEETAKKFEAKFTKKLERSYDGFDIDLNSKIMGVFIKACKNIGLTYLPESCGGGSDANIYGKKFPCINLGIGMSKVHTKEEYVEIEDIINCTRLLLGIVREL